MIGLNPLRCVSAQNLPLKQHWVIAKCASQQHGIEHNYITVGVDYNMAVWRLHVRKWCIVFHLVVHYIWSLLYVRLV